MTRCRTTVIALLVFAGSLLLGPETKGKVLVGDIEPAAGGH
jgi:hypothetical protein